MLAVLNSYYKAYFKLILHHFAEPNHENLKKNQKKINYSISFCRTFRTESNSEYALNSRVSLYLECNNIFKK